MNLRHAAAALPMPVSRYIVLVAFPVLAAATATVMFVAWLLPQLFTGSFALLLYALPVFALIALCSWPFVLADRKRVGIHNSIHLFITHLGVLATSSLGRVDIFQVLGQTKEYGALAEESHKIHELVKRWNMGLSDACRFVAKRTPSRIFSDFLERFAYGLDAGEDFEAFLRQEQAVVMSEYSTLYRGKLYEVENLRGLFVSLIMALIFMMIFILILPILTGTSPTFLTTSALLTVAFVEVIFVHLVRAKAPTDPLWYTRPSETRLHGLLLRTLPLSVLGVAVVAWAVLSFTTLPVPLILAVSLSPLLITGLAAAREEGRVKRRDDNFAAFVRSLGASASARGGAVRDTLRNLRGTDFGPLTEDVRALYHRLQIQIDDRLAWKLFAAESGSNLIEKFSGMFVEGIKAGGKADAIGLILSENFIRIQALRKAREQVAANLRGLLYGLAAGMAFALFVGLGVLKMIMQVFSAIEVPEGALFLSQFAATSFPIELTLHLLLALLLIHCLACALLVSVANGGSPFRSWVDFVGMFWVAALVSVVALWGLERLLGATTGAV